MTLRLEVLTGKKRGIIWRVMEVLEDLDYADDYKVRSSLRKGWSEDQYIKDKGNAY
jgi:hypothetical protein